MVIPIIGRPTVCICRYVAINLRCHDEKEWQVADSQSEAALLLGYPFYPESPYYLIKKGRTEQARNSLNRIHGSADQGLIDAEIARLEQAVAFSEEIRAAAQQKGAPFFQCFQGTNLVCLPKAVAPNST